MLNHIAQFHDCYFTDSLYTRENDEVGDSSLGLGLLNWDDGGYTPTCQLIIDD